MRWRVLAWISLGANLALVAAWLIFARHQPTAAPVADQGAATTVRTNTRIFLRRQFFSWRDVESDDYPTYISNLRAVGCPEQTVRDIIIADINALYARRRSLELVTPEQQWWRAEPDTNVVLAAAEKARELDTERRALLTRLLGANWESGDLVAIPRPSRPGIVLDGPVLGNLPAETKQGVDEATARAQERVQAYLDAQARDGKAADPVELAKIHRQLRDDLSRLLAPPQLEEFLLRYSSDAANLRVELGQLRYFEATPDEFRAMFRAKDAIDQRLELLTGNDDNTAAQRKALEQQRDNALKIALGAERYAQYVRLHDPGFRDAYAAAVAAGEPDSAETIYQINQAAAEEQSVIRSNALLTAEQKAAELKRVELQQLQAHVAAVGQDVPPDPLPEPPPPPKRTYVVQPGDSAAVLGMIYGVPESAIRAANPNVDFNRLQPGVAITIPQNALAPGQPRRNYER
jgi:LysM repeat protein